MTLLLALLAPLALAGPVAFQRVDVVSETPSTWLNHDLPMADVNATTTAIRFVEQVQVWWDLPVEGLSVGTSLAGQTVLREQPLLAAAGLTWGVGLQTRLLLPNGILADVAWRRGRVRVGLGASVLSSATWRRPDWTTWHVLPAVGLGVGRQAGAR